jgi:hypothetical protein
MKNPEIPSTLMGGFMMCMALKDDEHWAVYISLMKHGECRFDKLVELFGATYHELFMILDDLENGYVIEKFTIWDEEVGGDLSRYYYRATIYGLQYYARLMDSLFPSKKIQHWNNLQKWTTKSLDELRSQTDIEQNATFLPKATREVNLKVTNVTKGI